jgi:hypothetical protein
MSGEKLTSALKIAMGDLTVFEKNLNFGGKVTVKKVYDVDSEKTVLDVTVDKPQYSLLFDSSDDDNQIAALPASRLRVIDESDDDPFNSDDVNQFAALPANHPRDIDESADVPFGYLIDSSRTSRILSDTARILSDTARILSDTARILSRTDDDLSDSSDDDLSDSSDDDDL